jgi:hypothetical protein
VGDQAGATLDHGKATFAPTRRAVGLSTMSRWLFGRSEYAHPLLRWLSGPLFRVALLMIFLPIATGHAGWISWLGLVLMLVAVLVDLLNRHLMRMRRREATSRSAGAA